MRKPGLRLLVLLLIPASVALGCAANASFRKAEQLETDGQWDEAVLRYMDALSNDPGNIKYQAALLRAKMKASESHFEKGKQFEKANVLERALVEYQQATQLDPTNQYAEAQLEHVRRVISLQRLNRPAETIEQMKLRARGARPQPPMLNPRSDQPISLEFPQAVSIFQIYRALGQAFGINVLFDPNLKDQEIAIDLKDVTAQSALETLMHAAGHFYKVIDEHTILIAADTPQNRRTYEDLVIQTFYLSNAEVKDMTQILRSLIDAKKIATNEQLNAIILRDTADKVKVAEKIIETNDKAKAEVVVDVELLQIDTTKLSDLGIALSQYSIGQQLDTGTIGAATGGSTSTGGTTATTTTSSTSTPLRVSNIPYLNQSNWILNIPSFVYNFIKQNSEARLLAKPQLRITEGQKANLIIGDKVPIPLTTFNTSNTVGSSIVPVTSFQYQDVGVKIEIEPRVHHNQEVTLKVKIEVSNLGANIVSNGTSQPTIGTRSFDSTIRLKDGETNFLAGLIRDDDSTSDQGIPGLSDLPVIGRLFSDKNHQNAHTDVVLTLTPHIIRNAEITEEDLLPIWVGTEANVTFRGGSPRTESETEGPFESNDAVSIDEARQRFQRLPRSLQDQPAEGEAPGAPPGQQQQPAAPPPPTGVNLTPSTTPSSIFQPSVPATPSAPATPPPAPAPPPGSREQGGGAGLSSALIQQDAPRTTHSAAATAVRPAAYQQQDEAAAAGAAVRLWLLPQQLDVQPGDQFDVAVQVSAERPISHLPLTLAFDSKLLAVAKVAPGEFLGPSGTAEVLSDYSHPGAVVIGASRLGEQQGVTGAGTLVTVTFKALKAGAALVGFSGQEALDGALHPVLPITVQPARINVQQGGGGNGGGGGGHGGGPLPRDTPALPPGKAAPATPATAAGGAGPSDGE